MTDPHEKKEEDLDDHSSNGSTLRNRDVEKQIKSELPKDDAPDGGFAAWLVVAGVWCTSFCSFGWLNSIGVFQEYYQNVLLRDKSASTISWIPSLQIFFMMGMGPVVGIIYDKFGPRWLLLGGSFLHIFGVMMASLGKEYYQILLAQGFCSAIGVSALFQPAFSCLQGWFSRRRGAAFGIVFTGSSMGGVIFPIMISHIIREVSFAWAMRTSAFLMLFLLVIANLTVRLRVPQQPQKITGASLAKPFKELDFLLIAGGFFIFAFGFFPPVNFIQVGAIASGMDPDLVQYLIPILNAASLFGRLISGFVSDKVGRYNVFVTVSAFSGIWILALWLPDTSDAATIAFAVLFGFFSGAFASLIAPLVMQISPMAEIGFRIGSVLFLQGVGGLVTNPISGAILAKPNGWVGMKVFCGVCCLVGTGLMLAIRVRRVGWNPVAKF